MINNYVEYEYQACHLIHPFDQDKKYSLYLGDVSSALDLQFIHQSNIKTVVTAAAAMDQVSYKPQDNVKHIIYSVLDHKNQNLIKYFDQFFELVQKQIKNGSILVHCAAGISRSSTLVISYLMKKNNWTFKQAIKYVRNTRPMVLPNLGFQRQLKEYEKIIQQQQNRRLKSKTSESNKHAQNRMQILPEIGILGVNSTKNKVLDAFRIYKKQDQNEKINRRNFMFNNHILRNQNKVNSLKYQQLNKFKPQSREFGQTKSVSLQQGIERNIRNNQESTKITSYAEIKTDQTEVISSRKQKNSRNGLFDSAIIPIKYNTVSKATQKLKKTNIKFSQMNGNMIGMNKMNIFKQKYTKNSPTLSLGKVGLNDLMDGIKNDNDLNNGVENKTRLNFPIKLSKVQQSQSEVNYPMAVGRKDISMMKRDFWPLKKEIKNRNDEGKFDDDQSRKINIKNLLFYHND